MLALYNCVLYSGIRGIKSFLQDVLLYCCTGKSITPPCRWLFSYNSTESCVLPKRFWVIQTSFTFLTYLLITKQVKNFFPPSKISTQKKKEEKLKTGLRQNQRFCSHLLWPCTALFDILVIKVKSDGAEGEVTSWSFQLHPAQTPAAPTASTSPGPEAVDSSRSEKKNPCYPWNLLHFSWHGSPNGALIKIQP